MRSRLTKCCGSLRIPQRIGLVLQGESMLNDATALLIYRAAVLAAAVVHSASPPTRRSWCSRLWGAWSLVMCSRDCICSQARSCAIRPAAPFCNSSAPLGCGFSSERLGLSPIITVVVYAMTLAQAAPGGLGARLRISSYSVWETAVFVVNVLAFVLMGLQARLIIERLSPDAALGLAGVRVERACAW